MENIPLLDNRVIITSTYNLPNFTNLTDTLPKLLSTHFADGLLPGAGEGRYFKIEMIAQILKVVIRVRWVGASMLTKPSVKL
jgi:hypothetical protein